MTSGLLNPAAAPAAGAAESAEADFVQAARQRATTAWHAAGLRLLGGAVMLPSLGLFDQDQLDQPGPPADVDFRQRIGRRGINFNERATLLAVCAARSALAAAPAGLEPLDRAAVIVGSAFGNLDTVATLAQTINQQTSAAVSSMSLPNASLNVIAARLAIDLGCHGVCLTASDGRAAGWAALEWTARLLVSGRADRVLLVGAEGASPWRQAVSPRQRPPVEGAAALVVGTGPDGSAVSLGQPDAAWFGEVDLAALAGPLHLAHALARQQMA
ncbi:MAG: hypothetical protein LBH76_03250 [Propionibacteriaceae bacterium]|nr:hypothetical protein [Propionibacteriaceae bacterium]